MIDLKNTDCLEAMRQMTDNQFDLAIVDPPYGIARFQKVGKGDWIHNKSDANKNWNNEKPSQEYFNQLFRISKNQIIWGANNFNLPASEYFCIWDKNIVVPNFASCELAYVSMGLKSPSKIFKYNTAKITRNKIHPAQKPVKLYEWILDNYANEGDKILDTHLGSGSIALACHNRGFDLTGFEIDSEYYEKAIERLRVHQSQLTMF